jgi:hypothetical protein
VVCPRRRERRRRQRRCLLRRERRIRQADFEAGAGDELRKEQRAVQAVPAAVHHDASGTAQCAKVGKQVRVLTHPRRELRGVAADLLDDGLRVERLARGLAQRVFKL